MTPYEIDLLNKIQEQFFEKLETDKKILNIINKLDNSASFEDANKYAIRAGELLSDILKSNLKHFKTISKNTANNIIRPTLETDYNKITEVIKKIKTNQNKASNISLQPQVADLNTSRIDGLIDKVSSYNSYSEAEWVLGEPIVNYSQAVVDDSEAKNMEVYSKAGMEPKIVREAEPGACRWCKALAGTYDYARVKETGSDVYRRHENCRCIITFENGKKRQNVHSKAKWEVEEEKALKERIKKEQAKKLEELEKKQQTKFKTPEGNKEITKADYEEMEKQLRDARRSSYTDENGDYFEKSSKEVFKDVYDVYKKYQSGEANADTFFFDTMSYFEKTTAPKRKPDYISYNRDGEISSKYWYTKKGVYRESNHWGFNIASCDWALEGSTNLYGVYGVSPNVLDKNMVGFSKWENFVKKVEDVRVRNLKNEIGTIYKTFDNTIDKDEYIYKNIKAFEYFGR